MYRSTRQFVDHLISLGQLKVINKEVDPYLEIAEIHRRVHRQGGPALLFTRPKGASFPIVTNLYGTPERVNMAFGLDPKQRVSELVHFLHNEMPPSLKTLWNKRRMFYPLMSLGTKKKRYGPVCECVNHNPDLNKLPMLTSWPKDGGAFVTLPLVYTESTLSKANNLGMYRIQRHSKNKVGLHFQITKGGGYHYYEAQQQNKPLPVTISIGGPPALMLSAISPLPEHISELLLASFILKEKIPVVHHKSSAHPLFAECEFAIHGTAEPHVRHDEGPFGDHYGIYSLKHPFPCLNVKTLYHRKDAIYPATVVGIPPQEDFYIGEYLQELFQPLLKMVMPSVIDVWSYAESGFHTLSTVVTKERHHREAMTSAFRVLGEGQLGLTKCLFVINDTTVNIRKPKEIIKHLLERFDPRTGLYIFNHLSMDTLDYSSSKLNKGSRAVFLGLGDPIRKLPKVYNKQTKHIKKAHVFTDGCLVISTDVDKKDINKLINVKSLVQWPLIFITDDVDYIMENPINFMWHIFIHFDPANDIHSSHNVINNHIEHNCPIIIDARSKEHIPDRVSPCGKTASFVSDNWSSYWK